MNAERINIKQYSYWKFTCDCEHQIIWGAHVDKSFWESRSKQKTWAIRTCKCATKYELNAITNEIKEVA